MKALRATYFQIAKLSELLSTLIKPTCKWLDLLVYDLVSSDIASLSKGLAANVAIIRSLSRVSSLVRLYTM